MICHWKSWKFSPVEMFKYRRILEGSQHCAEKCGYSISLSVTSWFLFFSGSFPLPLTWTDSDLQTTDPERKPSPTTYKGLEVPDLISHLSFWKENIFFTVFCPGFFYCMLPKKIISILCFWLFFLLKSVLFYKFLEIFISRNSVASSAAFLGHCGFWDMSSCLGLGLPRKT